MDNINLQKQKEIQIEIVKFIHEVCQQNGLRYSVCCGSLIGAIRHGGFIPWDDDIDVYMPRDDYEILRQVINTSTTIYRFISGTDANYYHLYGKVIDTRTKMLRASFPDMGIGLDVFPLDGLPGENMQEARTWFKRLRRMRVYLYNIEDGRFPRYYGSMKQYVKSIIGWCLTVFYEKKLGASGIQEEFKNRAKRFSYDSSQFVGNIGGRWGAKEIYRREWFDTLLDHDFENVTVKIPKGYDECLRQLYGDYMALPPKEEQVPDHQYDYIWKSDM